MDTLVVYFTKFGNTQQVAEAIAESLKASCPTRVVEAGDLSEGELEAADLVVMGTPTHNMNLPKPVKPVFERFPKRILRGKPVAAFDTSYRMSWFLNRFTASKRLSSKLRKLGGKRVLPPETFIVEGREGPLAEGELERAGEWGRAILDKVDH